MNHDTQLGKRLAEIAKLITQEQSDHYDLIWDCCCDHGYLGAYLLQYFTEQNRHKTKINFVDQVSHITQQLQKNLSQTPLDNYQILTKDTGQLDFDKNKRHCIIIAGVTTKGTLKLLQEILAKHPYQTLDFILCPTRGHYILRHYLMSQDMHLIDEAYIEENTRHYEVLFVRHQANQVHESYRQVSTIGEFWQENNQAHIRYLKNRISYYKQELLAPNNVAAIAAIQLYSDMHQKISSAIS